MSAQRARLASVVLALTAVPALAGSDPHYLCVLSGGTRVVVAQDLHAAFPGSVSSCTATPSSVSQTRTPEPAPPPPPWRRFLDEAAAISSYPARRRTEVQPTGGSTPAPSITVNALLPTVDRLCQQHHVDPGLVLAMIRVESGFHGNARSPKGALGLMQVMPETARRYGVERASDLFDPAVNLDVGIRYLVDLQRQFDYRMPLVIAAYNAGEGTVARYGNRIPPFPETRDYVAQVFAAWRSEPRPSPGQ